MLELKGVQLDHTRPIDSPPVIPMKKNMIFFTVWGFEWEIIFNVKKVEPNLLVTRFGKPVWGGRKVMGMNCLWPSPRWAKKSFNNRGDCE